MDAISLNPIDINIAVYIATNMLNAQGEIVPLDASANSNRMAIIWEPNQMDSITLAGDAPELAFKRELNIRQPVCIMMCRNNVYSGGISRDSYYAVIDNIRVSEPPTDVMMSKEVSPFVAYPSVNANMNLQFRIDNPLGPYPSFWPIRTVRLVSRWNYLNQKTTAWVTNQMTCVNTGDGAGNGELWQPQTPMPAYPDAGDLEYYFLCHFDGTYYQSYDYTVYPKVLNPSLFPPENLSPRTFSADGVTCSSGTNNPFVFPLRLFPSDHGDVTTLLHINGSETPIRLPMTLVGTNQWQAKYDVVNYPDVTNLLWYYEATGAYTNAFTTTTEKHYWQNIDLNGIQSSALPCGGTCEATDSSLTNRPLDWFGVQVTPGESNYVLFTLDTAKNNYLAGRGEYQNFNTWNVGAQAQNYFSDADDKYPKVSYPQSFSNGWQQSSFSGMSNWFITDVAYTVAQTSPVRVGPEGILNQVAWNAGSFQYVVERTVGNTRPDYSGTASQRRNQAIRLLGGSQPLGLGYYQGNQNQQNAIRGIGTMTYKARLSRPIATDPDYNYNVAYRFTDMARTNYVISTSMCATSMSPETPSMSIIAYYQHLFKFYEYRITQVPDSRDLGAGTAINTNWDKRLRHEIWKWDGTTTPKLLASLVRTTTAADIFWDAKLTDGGIFSSYPTEFHVYNFSGTATRMKVKLNQMEITGWTLSNGATATGSVVEDANTPIRFGSYGFHSADCTIWAFGMWIENLDSFGNKFVGVPVSVFVTPSEWYLAPGFYKSGMGFMSENISTPVQVSTGTSEFGPWTPFKTDTVSSYYYQTFTATTNAWNDLCAKIQACGSPSVVLDGIHVGSWRGENITSIPSDNWRITEGWMSYNATDKWFAHLDASQADPSLIQSVRSKQVLGIGSLAFDYRVTRAPAKIKIQYTTNIIPNDESEAGWTDITNLVFTATTGWSNVNRFLAIAPATNLYVRILNDVVTHPKSIVDVRNIVLWNNATNSPNDWTAYNMKITDLETDKWWLDKKTVSGMESDKARSGYLNNSTSANIIPTRPMDQFNPYILAPRLTRGLGTVSFLARAFTSAYAAGNTNTSITIYGATDVWDKYKPDHLWTKLHTFTGITHAFYRPYSYCPTNQPNDIKAVKLVVDGVLPSSGSAQRVCLDEVVVTEAIYPHFDITDVRLLLPHMPDPIMTQQPFEGEHIGVEARLDNFALEPQNIKIWLSYVIGTNTWGVFQAPEEARITKPMELVDPVNQIYRTTSDFSVTGIPAQEGRTIVQYQVWAEYTDLASKPYCMQHLAYPFQSPPWYPYDLNAYYAPVESPYYIVGATNSALWLTPSIQNVPYTGGVFTVFVGACSNWMVTSNMPWIQPLQPSGDLPMPMQYCVAPNSNTNSRSATLTYSSGTLSESLSVNQEPAPSDLSSALGLPGFTWTLGGDHLWFSQTNVVKTGISALQSGSISHNQCSWIETSIKGPSILSFWWRVSSEAEQDLLVVSIGGVPVKTISGQTEWKQGAISISPGEQVVRWTYLKNSSISSGNDSGWLDGLEWTPPFQVSVSFDPDPGELESTNNRTYTVGYPYETFPVATRRGYSFDGWFFQTGEDLIRMDEASIVAEYVTHLFARWTRINYAVQYSDTKGVQNPNPTAYTVDDAFEFLPLPDAPGFSFINWSIPSISAGSTGTITVVANWLPSVPLTGFALWADGLGLQGNYADLFMQDRNSDGIANGFEYAFGTNIPLSSLLLNIQFINGKAIVESPTRDEATLPYVDVWVRGSTNLLDWTLPMIPATDTTGKPPYRAWHEPEGTPPDKAFFKLEAELK